MKFGNEAEAYEWAVAVRNLYGSPRSPCYELNPEARLREYHILDALMILRLADRYDTVDWRGSWFREWFMPEPTVAQDWYWSESELSELHGAVKAFRLALEGHGYIR